MNQMLELSEAEFQRLVIELAQTLGYLVAHFRPGMDRRGNWQTAVAGDGAGFPDLVLVGRGQVVFAELKAEKGTPSAKQKDWLEAIEKAGGRAYLWRPSDWDTIVATLNRRAERAA